MGNRSKKQTFYRVDSLSALRDYLKWSPAMVKEVRIHPKYAGQVETLLGTMPNHVTIIESKETIGKAQGTIEVKLLEEEEFFNQVDQNGENPDVNVNSIFALDHVQDPRNLGAIIRIAAYYGLSFIVVPKDRQVQLTQVVVDTCQAGLAAVKVVSVTNLARFICRTKQCGYWVLGFTADSLEYDSNKYKFEKSVLVFGSEGSGLSSLIRKQCDVLCSVGPRNPKVESLNVAVACGIVAELVLNP